MNEQIAENLGRKYLIALTVVAILVLGDQALIQPYLMQLTIDAPLINTAGRQRMLSQRLAKAALASQGEWGAGKAYLEEMSLVLGLWSAAQEQLPRNGAGTSWAGRYSAAVRDGLQGLDPYFVKMRDAARRVIRAGAIDRPGVAAVRDDLTVILDNEAEYLRRIDQVVGLYESEARSRVVP